ncbi:hypothetical protein LCGC14_0543870 [marine sediment metagenome]|uniref:Uncharacterized protein n=1 Tax=marine sediment metagenome TaxID=412755 RepID=A0A0F9V0D3_9ZZZZ
MIDTSSIVRNKEGRLVGRILDRVFVKELYGNRHMLRRPIAWAIDCDIFDRVIVPNCNSIHIIDKDTGHKYICSVKTFQEKRGKLNRKYGSQYYLELVHWVVQ